MEVTKSTRKETKTIEVDVPVVNIQLSVEEARILHAIVARQNLLFDLYMKLGDALNGGYNA